VCCARRAGGENSKLAMRKSIRCVENPVFHLNASKQYGRVKTNGSRETANKKYVIFSCASFGISPEI